MKKRELSIDTKNKLAYIAAIFTVFFALFSGWMIHNQSDQALPLILGIGALIYGPLCFILYIIEVARGVFRGDDEEDIEEKVEETV